MSEAKKLFLSDKCCCCFSLETGGYIIGCIGTFTSFVLAGFYIKLIKDFWGATCDELKKNFFFDNFFSFFDDCDTSKTVSLTFVIILLTKIIIECLAIIIFIIGIKKRCHKLILPVIFTESFALIWFLIWKLIAFNKVAFASAIGYGSISIYFITIMASLYFKFKDEREETPRYSPAKGSSS